MNIFTLRKDKINKNGLIPVRMLITLNGQKPRRNIKNVKVLLKDWKNQRIKPNLKSEPYNFHVEYNKQLDEVENKVKLIFRYMILNDIQPTMENIIEKLENTNFSKNKIVLSFFDSFHEFIETSRNVKALNTSKKYVSTLNFYKDFQEHKNYKLRFDNINIEFYEKFRDYAFEERNTLNNYFGKIIDGLKTFMK